MRFRGGGRQAEPAGMLYLADLVKKLGQDNHIMPCTPFGGAANMGLPGLSGQPELLYGLPQYLFNIFPINLFNGTYGPSGPRTKFGTAGACVRLTRDPRAPHIENPVQRILTL